MSLSPPATNGHHRVGRPAKRQRLLIEDELDGSDDNKSAVDDTVSVKQEQLPPTSAKRENDGVSANGAASSSIVGDIRIKHEPTPDLRHSDSTSRTSTSTTSSSTYSTCPYLDTINRSVIDFDQQKKCSITLATNNIYCCLVCGLYLQGRGKQTAAYLHSINTDHYMYINLHTQRIYCLPDNYEVFDTTLQDIQANLQPTHTPQQIQHLDSNTRVNSTLDPKVTYVAGCMGMNNIRLNDWFNAVMQLLVHIPMLRDELLKLHTLEVKRVLQQDQQQSGQAVTTTQPKPSKTQAQQHQQHAATPLLQTFSELTAKLWSLHAFRSHVSPHEALQTISRLSEKRYEIGKACDPLQFTAWFLNTVQRELASIQRPPTIIDQTFRGELQITTYTRIKHKLPADLDEEALVIEDDDDEETKRDKRTKRRRRELLLQQLQQQPPQYTQKTQTVPFLYVSLYLPPAPLFQDKHQRTMIPQISIYDLLRKFDGKTEDINATDGTRRTYRLTKLPQYLILHYQRFQTNNWSKTVKNPTLVSFPLKNLDLKPYYQSTAMMTIEQLQQLSVAQLKQQAKQYNISTVGAIDKHELVQQMYQRSTQEQQSNTQYNLVGNLVHEGQAMSTTNDSNSNAGRFKAQVLHRALNTWYEMEDLHVWTTETMSQLVGLSEAYIQVYERQDVGQRVENNKASSNSSNGIKQETMTDR